MTDVSKDGPIQFERPPLVPTKVTLRLPYLKHADGSKAEIVLEDVSLDALRENGFVSAVALSRALDQRNEAQSALTTARSEHEAIMQGLRGELERAKAQVESLTGDREELERLRRQVHDQQSTTAAEGAKVAEGELSPRISHDRARDLCWHSDVPNSNRVQLITYINQREQAERDAADMREALSNSARSSQEKLRDLTAEREATRRWVSDYLINLPAKGTSSESVYAQGQRYALECIVRHLDALRSQPSPTREAKDSSPSPGVPVAAADSGAAKPRETADTVFAATDNPGDGAGAKSLQELAEYFDEMAKQEGRNPSGPSFPVIEAYEHAAAMARASIKELQRTGAASATGEAKPLCSEWVNDTGNAARVCSRPLGHEGAHSSRWRPEHVPLDTSAKEQGEAKPAEPDSVSATLGKDHSYIGPDGAKWTVRGGSLEDFKRAAAAQKPAEQHWSDCADCNERGGYCLRHPYAASAQPAQKAAFVVGQPKTKGGCAHPGCQIITARLFCADHMQAADPAPAAEVPVTRAEIVALLRAVADFTVLSWPSAMRRLADELAKRKEG